MYQWNAEQRNKTNLILVSFFFSWSSSKSRPKPPQSVHPKNLKYVICGQYAKRGEQKKNQNS